MAKYGEGKKVATVTVHSKRGKIFLRQQEVGSKPEIKIIRETPKAKLLDYLGVQFWVQNKWYNEDTGVLTPAGRKSYEEAKIKTEKKAEDKILVENKSFKKVKETEHAVLIEGKANNGIEDVKVEFWVPITTIDETDKGIKVQKGMLKQKLDELTEKQGLVKSRTKPDVETEKAIGYQIMVYENLSEQSVKRTLWFPRSVIKENKDGTVNIPAWI